MSRDYDVQLFVHLHEDGCITWWATRDIRLPFVPHEGMVLTGGCADIRGFRENGDFEIDQVAYDLGRSRFIAYAKNGAHGQADEFRAAGWELVEPHHEDDD